MMSLLKETAIVISPGDKNLRQDYRIYKIQSCKFCKSCLTKTINSQNAAISSEDQCAGDDVVFPHRGAQAIAVASVVTVSLHSQVVRPEQLSVVHIERVDRDLACRTKHDVVDDRRRAQTTLTRARVHAGEDAVGVVDVSAVDVFARVAVVHRP